MFLTRVHQAAGCSFKVAGRVAAAFPSAAAADQPAAAAAPNDFLRLEHMRHLVPGFAAGMFVEIAESDCRVDVSSSQLRAAAASAAADAAAAAAAATVVSVSAELDSRG